MNSATSRAKACGWSIAFRQKIPNAFGRWLTNWSKPIHKRRKSGGPSGRTTSKFRYLKTPKAPGITMPQPLLISADEVTE